MSHLIFYDGDCPLCNRVIRFLLKKDKKKIFLFASLQGNTAKKTLHLIRKQDPDLDTLIFLQDYGTSQEQMLIRGKAALRILWLLGGTYRFIGWLSYLPPPLFDLAYKFIAHRRYRLFNGRLHKITRDEMPNEMKNRFLP